LRGAEQFCAVQSLHIGANCISDARQFLHLPPCITSLQMQGNPCCSCPCARIAVLVSCQSIKAIDSQPVSQWNVVAAASAVQLQASIARLLVGASLLCATIASLAGMF
jgi:hypothetical protein